MASITIIKQDRLDTIHSVRTRDQRARITISMGTSIQKMISTSIILVLIHLMTPRIITRSKQRRTILQVGLTFMEPKIAKNKSNNNLKMKRIRLKPINLETLKKKRSGMAAILNRKKTIIDSIWRVTCLDSKRKQSRRETRAGQSGMVQALQTQTTNKTSTRSHYSTPLSLADLRKRSRRFTKSMSQIKIQTSIETTGVSMLGLTTFRLNGQDISGLVFTTHSELEIGRHSTKNQIPNSKVSFKVPRDGSILRLMNQ